MKHLCILLFCISLSWLPSSLMAQAVSDTIHKPQPYGLRIGADISKPLRTLLDDTYSGFELVADFRISKKIYVAAELGNEQKDRFESNLNSTTSGSYIKLGADFNAYNNWLGMNNAIFGGLRYGFASFKQELLAYGIYTTTPVFPPSFRIDTREYTGLTAHWAELVVGVKTEVLQNLYLSVNLQLKRRITEDKPENFDNLFIPGFNRTYDFSDFGAGYSYTISYLIPIFKK